MSGCSSNARPESDTDSGERDQAFHPQGAVILADEASIYNAD
jgi:hypothetical protein